MVDFMGSTPGSHRRSCSIGTAVLLLVPGAIGGGAAPPQAPAARPAQAVTPPTDMSPFAPAPANVPSGPPPGGAPRLPPPLPDASPPLPAGSRPAADAFGAQLVPGQVIEPIDLASALRLAGARDLDIAIAKERVCQALADLEQARVLWLPSLYLGPNWIRHDGQAQIVQGQVQSISKSSLFLGGTAAAGSSVSGPLPAGGPAQVTGLTTILRFSDAIFLPLAARQTIAAQRAGVQAAINDAL